MINKEKSEWLESIGAVEFKSPMKWHTADGMLYSENYINNTHLEEIKKGRERYLLLSQQSTGESALPMEDRASV